MTAVQIHQIAEMAIPVIVPLAIALEKKLFNLVAPWLRPVIAGLAGPLLDLIESLITQTAPNVSTLIMSGLAGVGVREATSQLALQWKSMLAQPTPEVTADPPKAAPPA